MSIILTISAGKGSVCVSNDVLKIEVQHIVIQFLKDMKILTVFHHLWLSEVLKIVKFAPPPH